MSQTDINVTYVSAADLLGKTDRTKLIPVDLPDLQDEEGNPCRILLRPPTAAVANRLMAYQVARENAKGKDAEMGETELSLFAEIILRSAVTPDRQPLYPEGTTVDQVMEGLSSGSITRIATAISENMAGQHEEGAAKSKKSKKTRRSASATKSPGEAE